MLGALSRVDPDEARRAARDIVDSRRYRPERVPRPLEGVLEWIGDRLEPVWDLFRPIWDFFGAGIGRVIFLVALVALVAAIAYRLSRLRVTRAPRNRRRAERTAETSIDPDELEREAAAAEAAGDLNRAIRLRFRAGLLRLDRAGAIRYRPSLTSGQVAHTLRSQDFEELAERFDAIAYGGRVAATEDVIEARERWPRVLTEARGQ